MKIVMMACTARGFDAMRRCGKRLKEKLPEAEILETGRCAHVPGYEEKPKLSELTAEWFEKADALVFFTAAGIAVRCISPFVKDKFRDPAVLVIDENARFVIPVLSGHAGGANRLAGILAETLDAQPVITTATDGRGLFAVDVFAAENGFVISDRKKAKQISARLLAGEKVTVFPEVSSDVSPDADRSPDVSPDADRSPDRLPDADRSPGSSPDAGRSSDGPPYDNVSSDGSFYDGALSDDLWNKRLERYGKGAVRTRDRARADIILSFRRLPEDPGDALYLIPRILTLGIGCRKGISCGRIRDAVSDVLNKNGIFRQALSGIASIDLKKNEAGLLAFAKEWNLPVIFYTADELCRAPGEFTSSLFVKGVTGVDNVCERSAVLLAGKNGRLLIGKQSGDGVTAAVAAGPAGPD